MKKFFLTSTVALLKTLSVSMLGMMPSETSAYNFEKEGIYYNITSSINHTVAVSFQDNIFGTTHKYNGDATSESLTGSAASGTWSSIKGPTRFTSVPITLSCDNLHATLTLPAYIDGHVTVPNGLTLYDLDITKSSDNSNMVFSVGEDTRVEGYIIYQGCSYTGGNLYLSAAMATSSALYIEMTIYFKISADGEDYSKAINFTYTGDCMDYFSNTYSGSIKIPETVTYKETTYSVTGIGKHAFYDCSRLTFVDIPNSVTIIENAAFYGCYSLTSVVIPNSVTSIENSAFDGCSSMSSVILGDNVALIGKNAFVPISTIYVNKGTCSLFASWNAGYAQVKEVGTENILLPLAESTQTASSITARLSYLDGPANITSTKISLNGATIECDTLFVNRLNPQTEYDFAYSIEVDEEYEYSGSAKVKTSELNFVNEQPKVITDGNIVVASQSNLDDEEENVGFQWRRMDWTDEFESNSGKAYLYEGMMEGYIRNLNTNYLWKFRPYYQSADGSYFYGDWTGMDPTDVSYFEPTVHTYAKATVEGNTVEVKGYAQRGTDNIVSQGFMYWVTSPQYSPKAKAQKVPSTAQTVEASGTVMTANLADLDYETTYAYVAFVKTSEGETFYGEEKTFITGADPTGIEVVHSSQFTVHNGDGVYDLSGRQINANDSLNLNNLGLKRGIYIKDGKKVLIR